MKKYFFLLCFLFLLAGCQGNSYTPIAKNKSIIITANIKEGSVSFIDEKSKKTVTTWDLKEPITGVTLLPSGEEMLVYGKQLEYAYIYSLTEGNLVDKWKTGKGITNVIVANDGKQLFMADQNEQKVRFFTTSGKETGSVSVGKGPLTMVQNDKQLHVLNFYDTQLSTIDLNQKKVVHSFMVPPASTGAMVSADGKEIWIGGHGDGTQVNEKVLVYSLENGQMLRSLHAPFMPVSLAGDEKFVYALSHGSNILRKFDTQTYKEVGVLEVGSNPFSFLKSEKEGYVASYDSNEVYVIDIQNMKIKQTISVGKGPFQLVQREGREK
ncbi:MULTISPECIES: YncE family protein [Bacillus cereus group]|uniref:40-residue YVTN family beta-propeller n=1 Tax=Bacillus cereus TaxID=1396 RepID=A0AA44QCT8_BACCE|nr:MULTISPECIES: lipoprotein [Bacillus cereus group]PFN10066.1 40-residue YVTN family beta-propeller [Bacillus cereus]PFO84504.1 40-residue YVTN family beta-propeller [Bacillus cereus]PFS05472.1 40-residue YVTN family beta-propeller [Bacillus cereus]